MDSDIGCSHTSTATPASALGPPGPSGTDEHFQRRLEAAGYPTIAAIFSRDGYIRFFRLDHTPSIHIYGHGVEHVDQQIYRLRTIDPSVGRRHSERAHSAGTNSWL